MTGAATLGGTLNITLGFTPTVGQTFTILTASSLGGTQFTTVNGLATVSYTHLNTFLEVNSATAKLQGSGTVTFSDNNQNYILATAGGDTLTIAQPVSGPGGNIGNGSLVITNQSTICLLYTSRCV